MIYEIAGQHILITGAAGSIGEALAEELTKRGAIVSLVDKSNRVHQVAAKLGAASAQADVTDSHSLEEAVAELSAADHGFDVVIVNAGVAIEAPVLAEYSDTTPDPFELQVNVNLIGSRNTVRAAMPHMRAGGYVLLTSSLAANVNLPHASGYSASKAGVDVLASSLILELKGTGVHVGVAAYSQLENEMTESFDSESAQWIFRRRHLHMIHRPVDQQVAVKAVCRGIERRSRRIAAPAKARYARWAGMALQFALVRWVPDIRPAAQIWKSDQQLQGREVELRLPVSRK